MIDIVCFKGEKFNLGFFKIYNFEDFNIVVGGSDNKNRKALSNKNTDILLSPEKTRKKDFIHSRNSGLNHVLCKLAKENNIAIGFSFNEILKSKERNKLIGRMMQNIKLCRKYKVKMIFASFAKNKFEMRAAKDLLSFCRVLGMMPKEAKNALNQAENIFKKNQERKSKNYIAEGIKIIKA